MLTQWLENLAKLIQELFQDEQPLMQPERVRVPSKDTSSQPTPPRKRI